MENAIFFGSPGCGACKQQEELLRKKKEEPGCTEPMYGKKSKCVIKIVPQDTECETMEIDEKCVKKRI